MDMITIKNAMNAEEFTVHAHRLKHNAQAWAPNGKTCCGQ